MTMPYVLIGLGAVNIFFGLVSHNRKNKTSALIRILVGLFIIIIGILKII